MRFVIDHQYATTRDLAAQVRSDLETELRGAPPGEIVELSFERVDAMTISFTDELLGKLLAVQAVGIGAQNPIVLTGLDEDKALEVNVCLERTGALVVADLDGTLTLLGGDPLLRDTFAEATKTAEVTSSELARRLGISAQNVNNRLKRLLQHGALARRRADPASGGREFVYHSPSRATAVP